MPDFLLDLPKYNDAFPVGARRLSWPFEENGDVDTIQFIQDYLQRASQFKKLVPGTENESFKGYYLVAQPDPALTHVGNLARFSRTYVRIPGTQTVYSTISITRPSLTSVGIAINLQRYLGGGAYDNLGVNYTYLNYFWDVVDNKVYGPLTAITSVTSGANTRLTWAGHGVVAQPILVLTSGGNSNVLFTSAQYTVIDANTIDLLGVNYTNLAYSAGKYFRDYTPGLTRLSCKIVSDFFLPGVSGGITTPADITIPASLLVTSTFLAAVVANLAGYVTYDVRDLARWLNGPIYRRDTIQINMASL